MDKAFLVAVLCVCCIALTSVSGQKCPRPRCPKNSRYSQCRGCQKSCSDMYLNKPCPLNCESGCTCKSGLVRNENGQCVHPEECQADEIRCPANLQYNSCGGCMTTCDNMNEPQICDKRCHLGCYCPQGLVYNNATGSCVAKEECCPKNSHYETCGSACPKTCKNLYSNDQPCTLQCVPGCVCDDGFVKNDKGECVSAADCLIREIECPANKTFTRCGMACRTTCTNVYQSPRMCPMICLPGCRCKRGLVENKKGECVPALRCPREEIRCPSNLEYQTCAGCPETCNDGDVPRNCTLQCRIGCFCPKDLRYDNRTSSCVDKDECFDSLQNQDCRTKDPNSEFKTCASCNPTCFNRRPACTLDCRPGCQCRRGYVEDPSGKCVIPSQCPVE